MNHNEKLIYNITFLETEIFMTQVGLLEFPTFAWKSLSPLMKYFVTLFFFFFLFVDPNFKKWKSAENFVNHLFESNSFDASPFLNTYLSCIYIYTYIHTHIFPLV